MAPVYLGHIAKIIDAMEVGTQHGGLERLYLCEAERGPAKVVEGD